MRRNLTLMAFQSSPGSLTGGIVLMHNAIDLLVHRFQSGHLSRREVVTAPAALFAASAESAAQTPAPPVAVRTLNHVSISVADIKRSVEFYRSLFGMRVI